MTPLVPSSKSVLIHGQLWATLGAAPGSKRARGVHKMRLASIVPQVKMQYGTKNYRWPHMSCWCFVLLKAAQAVPLIWKSLFTDLAQAGCFHFTRLWEHWSQISLFVLQLPCQVYGFVNNANVSFDSLVKPLLLSHVLGGSVASRQVTECCCPAFSRKS